MANEHSKNYKKAYQSRRALQRRAIELAADRGWQMRTKGDTLILHR